ncbi:MAG: hypothetical protein PUC09_05035 [Methanobrevibacter wolinii]|nr:hypothetical protein [Methanobrevibacter wolinii]
MLLSISSCKSEKEPELLLSFNIETLLLFDNETLFDNELLSVADITPIVKNNIKKIKNKPL